MIIILSQPSQQKNLENNLLAKEKTMKNITFTVPIEKEVTRIDKKGEEIIKHLSYILQFIDSARFMASSLSNIANNLSEGNHKIKCKYGHNDKG